MQAVENICFKKKKIVNLRSSLCSILKDSNLIVINKTLKEQGKLFPERSLEGGIEGWLEYLKLQSCAITLKCKGIASFPKPHRFQGSCNDHKLE